MTDDTPPTDAQLTRLADGSLPDGERARLRERVAGSPELQARLGEQEHAVSLMRSTEEVVAPASLRAAVSGLTEGRDGGRSGARRRMPWAVPRLVVPAAVALACVTAAIVILTGGAGAPTVRQTAHVALAAAVTGPPAADASDHERLAVRQSGIPFPSYAGSRTWRASGTRTDTLSGRRVTTVFYTSAGGARVGYAIVSGAALTPPAGRVVTGGGIRYVIAPADGGRGRLITWRRAGHTCVIAGRGVSTATLLRLAAADARVT
jgi:hypothetical protein